MKKEKIEINILLFMLIEALFLLFFFKYSLLNIILGSILGILLSIILKKAYSNKVYQFILFITSFFLFITVTYKIANFISLNVLRSYSKIIIGIIITLLSIYLAKRKYHAFIKSVQITSYFYLFIKLISILLSIFNLNINNINVNLLTETNISLELVNISLIILFISSSIFFLTNHLVTIKSQLLSILNPLLLKIFCILIIGKTLFYLYEYPFINIFKKIKYFDFIERMEGVLSFQYLFSFFFLDAFLVIIIITIAEKIFKKKNELNSS